MNALFTARIIKGGALLADTRRFLEMWEPARTFEENMTQLVLRRGLGKTHVREKVVLDILRRRLVDAGHEAISGLRQILKDPVAFREACYYETTRSDGLLAAFAEGPLFDWYQSGCWEVTLDKVNRWLATNARVPRWNVETRTRVAQGLLATLRDFGILEGAARGRRKRIRPPHVSLPGFIYVALRERSQRASDRAVLDSAVWRRYLLSAEGVRRLFLDADRLGCLRFAEAGSMVRVDWLIKDLEEIPNAIPA